MSIRAVFYTGRERPLAYKTDFVSRVVDEQNTAATGR